MLRRALEMLRKLSIREIATRGKTLDLFKPALIVRTRTLSESIKKLFKTRLDIRLLAH